MPAEPPDGDGGSARGPQGQVGQVPGREGPHDHATLAERGVEFIQEPAERPYGIEALLRDDSGNWFSFCQRT